MPKTANIDCCRGAPFAVGYVGVTKAGRGKLIRMVDVNEVADWMASEVEVEGFLYQDMAVAHIAEQFGDEFIYTTRTGPGRYPRPFCLPFVS